jgi:phage gp29-like protein
MKEVTLYDAYNQPIRKQDLIREYAAPSLTGVRTVWTETVASGLTPQRLAGLLQNANQGDNHDYLTLAEEMEEREPHYASVLGTRKRAVKKLPIMVEAASDDANDQKIADAVRELVKRAGFKGLTEDMLDAIGKGYSAIEIIWDRSASQWFPDRYEWRDPRFFTFDRVSQRQLRLLDEADSFEGIALPPYKFITHFPKLKSGLPIRGGLARLVAWSYMGKMYTFKDWLAFVEIFGMPLRVGKYGANATDADIRILKTAVANIGSDAAAVLPDSMKIEFEKAAQVTGGDKLYLSLAEWIDKQISKAVIGQTMTADDGSSQAQANVHNEVRGDITESDAEQAEETLNLQLVKPFVDLNFGPQQSYPTLKLYIKESEDIKALTDALDKLVPLGLRVEQSVVRDKLNLPDPPATAKPEDLLGIPGPGIGDQGSGTANNHQGHSCPHCATALNQEATAPDAAELIAAQALDRTADADLVGHLYHVIAGARTLEAASTQLNNLRPDMLDSAPLAATLGNAMLLANLTGRDEIMTDLAMNAEAQYGSLPFDEAIAFFRQKLNIPAQSWTDLWKSDHDHGFTVAGVMRDDMLADFRAAIDQAITDGTTQAAFLKDFDTIVAKYGWSYNGSRGWRSRIIYETNIRTAYQAGRYQQMTDPDVLAYRPNWMYQHGDSIRPRPMHLGWNGITLPANDPWWDSHFTPNGWGCKCRVVALSDRDLARKGVTVGKAPDDGTFEWLDKKTGEIHDVPRGIDPGWDYNPGKSWLNPASGKLEPA